MRNKTNKLANKINKNIKIYKMLVIKIEFRNLCMTHPKRSSDNSW